MKLVAASALFAAVGAAPLLKSADSVPGEYVVKMRSGFDSNVLSKSLFAKKSWKIGSFNAFSTRLSDEELERVLADPSVDLVSPNVIVYTTGIIDAKRFVRPNVTATKSSDACPDMQSDHSWGQARITGSDLTTYNHDANWGAGVDIYVADTGTLCAHEDFAGRSCECGPDFSALVGPGADGCADGNGHGTFCSSIAAGNVYGVSKSANLIGVKVMGDLGTGTLNGIIDGFNYIAEAAAATGRPSVASISLGTQGTNAMVDAAANALAETVQAAIAAGNSGMMPAPIANTCTGSSPGAAENPVTVGASNDKDLRASFSNYGSCNDIYAPGEDITGAYSTRSYPTDQYITGSGTSMATPHVAGLMAAMLSIDMSLTPEQLKAKVIGDALVDVIDHSCGSASGNGAEELCEATPNTLLHLEC